MHAVSSYPRLSRLRRYRAMIAQYGAPQRLLTRLMYLLTRARAPWWKNWQIRWFVRKYDVDMNLTPLQRPEDYPDFNTFFTRSLKPGARAVASAPADVVCPVDGTLSEAGRIAEGRLLQAKGKYYSAETLLGSRERAAPFRDGDFATIYLAPWDYHRIHMPRDGVLREMTYIPGKLFSVSPLTVQLVPGLFARNERLVTLWDTDLGPMAVVLVGAFFVAGLETVWSGAIEPSGDVRVWEYGNGAARAPKLERGQELGRFNMGSTVIVLFPPDAVELAPDLQSGTPVRMGQRLARALITRSAL